LIVIFSSQQDAGARMLAERWGSNRAAVLTPRDLSRPGWRHDLRRPQEGAAVVAGQRVCVREIDGVLIRWPAVFQQELLHILPKERSYVASEMTAFLRSWLTQLSCPIVNPPTAGSLLGPSWRREQWVHAAARMRIPVHAVRRRVALANDGPPRTEIEHQVTVTVVGERCFGDAHPTLCRYAKDLAAAAGVPLLAVQFSAASADAKLQSADLLPDLDRDDVIDAVLEYLLYSGRTRTERRSSR
jgi:hypothetical protein